MTDPAPPNPPKRPVGRPKGSKNGPDAGKNGRPVGRPRKNPPNEQRDSSAADSTRNASGDSALPSRGRSKTIEATVVQRPLRLPGSSRGSRSSRSVSLHHRGTAAAGRDDSRARSNEAAAASSRDTSREAFPVESGDIPGASPPVVTSSTSASASTQLASRTPPCDEERRETAPGPTDHEAFEATERAAASGTTGVATPEAAEATPRVTDSESDQQPVAAENGQATVRADPTPENNEPEMLPRDIQGDETAAEAVSLQRRPAPGGDGDGSRGRSITLERDFEDGEEAADDVEYGVDDEGEFRVIPDDDDEDDTVSAASDSASDAATADVPNVSLPSGTPSGVSSAKTKKSRSGLPTWLPKEYREICATLRTEMEKSPRGWPACYEAGSFYYTAGKNPFFVSLTRSQLDPMMFWRPRYFIWFPHLFQRIPCPECVTAGRRMVRAGIPTLSPYTTPKGPRHVYDVTDHVYIIGQRYRCQHDKCKKTYQSWSPAVLNAIPPALAAQFTFHLSYRSGLTDDLAALLRSNFQRGTGPVPFAEMIRTFHIRRWEQLLQQYLEMVYSRADAVSVGLIALHETFGEWNDTTKYAGSAPSSNYCSAFYVNFMRRHGHLMDKRMSMLTGRAMCLDLSFKVIKHLGKVDGVPIFGSLLSVVNEFGECRAMTLTMTKAHDQFMPTLAEIPRSLELYGHDDTEVVFTDNPKADKAELERIIPALLHGVERVPSSSLKPLVVPTEYEVFVLGSLWLVNSRLEALMETVHKLPKDEEFPIAMDMEWPVDLQTGIHGRVALITIVFARSVYLIPLPDYLHDGILKLPRTLYVMLRSSRIIKYGVHVKADLTRLFHDCGFKDDGKDERFVGARELGAMAHKQGLAMRANTSLADLTARVLQRSMAKEASIRISTGWDSPVLSQAHIDYAVLDTYAAWALYEALSAHSHVASGQPVTAETPVATAVKLLSRDRSTVIAFGIVAPDRAPTFNGVNVTKTRILVNITSVLLPAYLVRKELLPSRVETALSEVVASGLPCRVLCCVKDLQTCQDSEERGAAAAATEKERTRPEPSSSGSTLPAEPPFVDTLSTGDDARSFELPAASDTAAHAITEASMDMTYESGVEQKVEGSETDAEAMQAACALANTVSAAAADAPSPVRSRVIGDIWHLMDQFKIPLRHGLRRPFLRALRDALLIPDEEDKAAMAPVLATKKTTWEKMVLYHPDWVWRRVKRFVPSPEELVPRLLVVFQTFGPLKDAVTGQPLFTKTMWKSAENTLGHGQMGHYTDPPGVALYYPRGKDKDGLMLYRCIRGTNNVEGGIHQNLAKRFGSYNVSPEFAWSLLRDYTLRHNLVVGTLNRTGLRYNGSFDIWTRNRISRLLDLTTHTFVRDQVQPLAGWINTDDYEDSSEQFGIQPTSDAVRKRLGMLEYLEDHARAMKIKHADLARQQGVRFAILPVHTPEEKALYRLLIHRQDGPFSQPTTPNWVSIAQQWSSHCDGISIFYKLPEHLQNCYKKWLDNRNQENSIEQNIEAYNCLQNLLVPQALTVPRILIRENETLDQQLDPSRRRAALTEVSQWRTDILLGSLCTRQSAVQFSYMGASGSAVGTAANLHYLPPGDVPRRTTRPLPHPQ